jgi:hypothetical protein
MLPGRTRGQTLDGPDGPIILNMRESGGHQAARRRASPRWDSADFSVYFVDGRHMPMLNTPTKENYPLKDRLRRSGSRLRPSVRALVTMLVVLVCACLSVARAEVVEVVLYDGRQQAETPDQFQPTWLMYAGIGGSQSYLDDDQATHLDTRGQDGNQAGYTNYRVNADFPELNRHWGYTIGFTLAILEESQSQSRPERAGFSIIATSSDVGTGMPSSIEIGFQNGRVFAQSSDFGPDVADENTQFNPVGPKMIDYLLHVRDSSYELWADDDLILSGALHDYSDTAVPYGIANYLFLGDNTTSAQASVLLQRVTVTAATVPEPASLVLLVCGLLALGACARHRRRGTG